MRNKQAVRVRVEGTIEIKQPDGTVKTATLSGYRDMTPQEAEKHGYSRNSGSDRSN